MKDAKRLAIIQLVFSIALVAMMIVYAKQGLLSIPPLTFLWLQMLVGSVAMLFYTFVLKRESWPKNASVKEWLIVVGIGLLNFFAVRSIFIYALEVLAVTTHAFIMSFVAIVTFGLSSLLLKEKGSLKQLTGTLLATFGLWIFFKNAALDQDLKPIFWLVFAMVCLSLTNILLRMRHLLDAPVFSTNQVACISVWIGSLPLVIGGVLTDLPLPPITTSGWLTIIANGVIVIAYGMVIFTHVMRFLKAYEASVIATCGVVFTAIFGIPVLGVWPLPHEVLGIILVIGGILLVQMPPKTSKISGQAESCLAQQTTNTD